MTIRDFLAYFFIITLVTLFFAANMDQKFRVLFDFVVTILLTVITFLVVSPK